jgi:four helix bundle protein
MGKIEKFEDINAWKKARELTKEIYSLTNNGDFSKDYSLKDQVRRCSVSVSSNIAEGFERQSDKEFARFLSIAKGSCGELRSQIYIALDVNYINKEQAQDIQNKAEEISKMIAGLIKYLKISN